MRGESKSKSKSKRGEKEREDRQTTQTGRQTIKPREGEQSWLPQVGINSTPQPRDVKQQQYHTSAAARHIASGG